MSAPTTVNDYMRELERRLEGQPRRARVLAELSDHLHEAVDEERGAGCADAEAERRAVTRCGDPAVVARRFMRHPPRYLEHKVKLLFVIAVSITAAKVAILMAGGPPKTIDVWGLSNDELRKRVILFLGLFMAAGMAQLCRWMVLQHRGMLVEVSSAAGLPEWQRRARPWLIATGLFGFALACGGLWAPARWHSASTGLVGAVFAFASFVAVRRHFWQQALQ